MEKKLIDLENGTLRVELTNDVCVLDVMLTQIEAKEKEIKEIKESLIKKIDLLTEKFIWKVTNLNGGEHYIVIAASPEIALELCKEREKGLMRSNVTIDEIDIRKSAILRDPYDCCSEDY